MRQESHQPYLGRSEAGKSPPISREVVVKFMCVFKGKATLLCLRGLFETIETLLVIHTIFEGMLSKYDVEN